MPCVEDRGGEPLAVPVRQARRRRGRRRRAPARRSCSTTASGIGRARGADGPAPSACPALLSPNSFARRAAPGCAGKQAAAARRRHSPRLRGSPSESSGAPIGVFAYLCKLLHIHADDRPQGPAPAGDRGPDPRAARSPARTSLPSACVGLGFAVTQATISRDLEQLGAVKVRRDGAARPTPCPTSVAQRAPARASPRCSATGCARSMSRQTWL